MAKKIGHDDIDKFHDYSIHVPTRTIYMGSEHVAENEDFAESGCDGSMAERFVKNLHILEAISSEPIIVIMNNPGGDHYHGMAIYDAIKNSPAHVTIKVIGHAFSMGSIILQAADERLLMPNSRVMIHYGTQGASEINTKDFAKLAQESERLDVLVEDIYLERMREKEIISREELKKLLSVDTYLSPEEAVKLGLADKVIGDD